VGRRERHRAHLGLARGLIRLAGAALLAAAFAAAAADDGARVVALGERFYETLAQADPVVIATQNGDNRYDDRLGTAIVPSARAKRYAIFHQIDRDLMKVNRAALSAEAATHYDVLRYQLDTRLAFEKFPEPLLPVEHMGSLPVLVANFGTGQAEQPLTTVAEYEAYLARVAALPAWVDQAIANLREGIRRGVTQPRPIVRSLVPQLKTLADPDLQENPYYAPVKHMPAGFSEAERARLTRAYRETIAKRAIPAMRKLYDMVEKEYLPAARESIGLSALPGGADWYLAHVREETTTTLSPDEIHVLGLAEVARIQGEIARMAPKLGYEGDPRGLLAWVREQPRFKPFTSEQQILDAYAAINERIVAKLPQLFGRTPRAAIVIKPEPPLTRATASDHYSLPAADGSRPGTFWAVINDPRTYGTSFMAALFMHEGQPGHHFHMALQQELPLPRFRKNLWINAYGEGWALYAETLGHEMGFYADPLNYVGELNAEIVRAVRLVVDTGIHARGWSYQQAVDYYRDNVGANDASARRQVERFIAWPGQALGYKIGALRIQALRERARKALGERFRLADFHDEVLREGALPLALLERRIDEWIAARAHP
jgi:uncharacterized protein (DUF885 family)